MRYFWQQCQGIFHCCPFSSPVNANKKEGVLGMRKSHLNIFLLIIVSILFPLGLQGQDSHGSQPETGFSILGGIGGHVVDGPMWSAGAGVEAQWRPSPRSGYNGSLGVGIDVIYNGLFTKSTETAGTLTIPLKVRTYMGVERHYLLVGLGPEVLIYNSFNRTTVLGMIEFGFSAVLSRGHKLNFEFKYSTDFNRYVEHDYIDFLLRFIF